jgi:hypothetical protein
MLELNDAQQAYLICKQRGHQPNGMVIDTYRPYDTCKYCGTTYRYEQVLKEASTPFGWVMDLEKTPDSEAAKIVLQKKTGS